MNRNQRRKFNKSFGKLSNDEQEAFVGAMITQKIAPVMNKEITKAMITGMNVLYEQLYTDFVSNYDLETDPYEKDRIIGELLSVIRTQYLRIESEKAKEEVKKDGESE